MKILDIHSHIGNLLERDGGDLIWKTGVKDRNLWDTGINFGNLLDAGTYAGLMKYRSNGGKLPKVIDWWKTYSGRQRNFSATKENLDRSLYSIENNKEFGPCEIITCCLPIAPNVTFEDINNIEDDRIIAFTSVDFTDIYGFEKKLKKHIGMGAKGLKLHPIIQQESLVSDKTREVVQEFGKYGLPVLPHIGITGYFLGKDKANKENPEYGNVDDMKELVLSNKEVPFIVGHAGILQVGEVIEKLSGLENVFLDVSFQSPESIVKLLNKFGTDRIMYASDWPYGDRTISVKIMKEACGGDKSLEGKVFYENAAKLIGL